MFQMIGWEIDRKCNVGNAYDAFRVWRDGWVGMVMYISIFLRMGTGRRDARIGGTHNMRSLH